MLGKILLPTARARAAAVIIGRSVFKKQAPSQSTEQERPHVGSRVIKTSRP